MSRGDSNNKNTSTFPQLDWNPYQVVIDEEPIVILFEQVQIGSSDWEAQDE